MRTYMVVIDETEEARLALRFASRRAAKTNGNVHILALVEQADFVAWGAVQATMEAEALSRAEELVASAAGALFQESGIRPSISVKAGEGIEVVKQVLAENSNIAALVLGAASGGSPGPLVSYFAATHVGTLQCPVIVVPGSLSEERIDEIS
ncbi:MAG: universal stress protein [Sphingomonadales bacterium]|nr:universal stress protein [Sphingomonadales bacterium]